jgi:hypothetical protein
LHARRTRAHSGAQAGRPCRGTPPTRALRSPASLVPRSPVPRPRPARIEPPTRFPIVRWSAHFWAKTVADSPRVIPETACKSSSWKWWPGTESNHRHADFQYDGEAGSVRVSRRPGRGFPRADRTAGADRAYPEPEPWKPTELAGSPIRFNGLPASRPNCFRTAHRPGLGGGRSPSRPHPRRRRANTWRLRADVMPVAPAANHAIRINRPYFALRMAAVSASSMTGVTTNWIIDSHWSVNL